MTHVITPMINISEANISANHPIHPILEDVPTIVAPATGKEFNRIQSSLIPKGCFRLEDNSFEFDSSFVSPITFDAGPLKNLLDKHRGSKLSIFGHADPTGDENYNKMLSDRRAQAIYGLLTRNISLWQELYFDHDTPGDIRGRDAWSVRAIQIMLNFVGPIKTDRSDGALDQRTHDALAAFEKEHKLPPNGFNQKKEVSPATFRKLAELYMNHICTDDDSKDFRLNPADFLAGEAGDRQGGKGNFQGCSEFNPVMVFSKEEEASFRKEENKAQRNSENRPNRRVMVLLFRQGTQVDPSKWPCPRAKEGIAGCRARFFSDGDQRRSPQAQRRNFEVVLNNPAKKGTFACRFYERVAFNSPCEGILGKEELVIRLLDLEGRPCPKCEAVVLAGGEGVAGKSDAEGILRVKISTAVSQVIVQYTPTGSRTQVAWPLRIHLPPVSDDAGAIARLLNLGYPADTDREYALFTFQRDHHLTRTSLLDDATRRTLAEVHDIRGI